MTIDGRSLGRLLKIDTQYNVKGLRDMHTVMKDVKRAYKRRHQPNIFGHNEFLRVSLAVIRSMNQDVANPEIMINEKTIRSFYDEGLLEFAMEAIYEPDFFEESQAVRIYYGS